MPVLGGILICLGPVLMIVTIRLFATAGQGTLEIKHPMTEPEYIDPNQLRPGPIRHESLPPELLDQIRAIFDVIGAYIGMALEHFEIGFMRDTHPETEVALWCNIAKAWLAYHEDFLGNVTLPDEDERRLLGALIAISTGVEDVSKLGVPVQVGRRLIQFYDDPAGNQRPEE